MDKAIEKADRIEAQAMQSIEKAYDRRVAAVIRKHRKTLDRIRDLEKREAYGRIRVLFRTSGLLDDLTDALAQSGKEAAAAIRDELAMIRDVMAQ